MTRVKGILLAAFSAIFLLYILILGLSVLLIRSDRLENTFAEAAKEYSQATLDFKNFHVNYFPVLDVTADEFVLDAPSGGGHLEGKRLKIKPSFWKVLFGHFGLDSLVFHEGQLQTSLGSQSFLEPLTLSEVEFQGGPFGEVGKSRFELDASYVDVPHALHVTANLSAPLQKKIKDWNSLTVSGELGVNQLILSQLSRILKTEFPIHIKDGQMSGLLKFSKKNADPSLEFQGNFKADQVIYSMQQTDRPLESSAMALNLDLHLSWNPDTSDLSIQSLSLAAPFGTFNMLGGFQTQTGEIREMRIMADKITVADIPQYILPLSRALPAGLGFSGASTFEASLEGTWKHLSVDATWDLGATLLTYGRYFSKPKELPMTALFHLLLEEGRKVSGDFSVRLKDMSCKGTITGLNFKDQTVQLNMISNKFKIQGWEELIPPLSAFKLDGAIKILANFVEDQDPKTAGQNLINLSLEDVTLKREGWPTLHHLKANMDLTSLTWEIKRAGFEINDSALEADLTLYNLTDQVNFHGKLRSQAMSPRQVAEGLSKGLEEWAPELGRKNAKLAKAVMLGLFPSENLIRNVDSSFYFEKGHFYVEGFSFEGYGGKGKLGMDIDMSQSPPQIWISADADGWDLSQYLPPPSAVPFLSGKLFLNGQFKTASDQPEAMIKSLSGEGDFSVTQGELQRLDLLQGIGDIDGFGEVGLLSNGKTSFRDLRGHFLLRDQKMKVDDLTLVSQDLSVEGAGEVGFDKNLNFRLETYLSTALTTHFLTPIFGSSEAFQGKEFGPIPLLLSGPMAQVQMKADEHRIEDLRNNLLRKKSQQILRNFIPEEQVLGKDKK